MITGGNRVLGYAIAERFAHESATVVVVARNDASVEAAVKQLKQISPDAFGVVADVAIAADRDRACAEIRDRGLTLSALVNNAGSRTRPRSPRSPLRGETA